MVKLGLTISKPALLLNRIAQRYSKLARILMEYVDNSLDDAETLYNRKTKCYKRHIKITIILGENPHTVAIVDNCRGMDRKQLTRLIQNVGESMKHSRFTNGQFGFGIHAFRAAARHMRVVSKTKNKVQTLVLDIDRDSMDFTAPRPLNQFDQKANKSGTQIFISEFDNTWTEGLNVTEIVNEIQFHFGALLERQNLTVSVRSATESVKCLPFDYNNVQGKRIKKNLMINGSKVETRLWVSPVPIENQGCYFVAHGRRIHEIHEIKSFMKVSVSRWSVWSHPNVVGYVEVGDVIEPVITRDEFRRTQNRSELYKQMVLVVEPILAAVITKVNQRRRVLEMGRLGNILSKCFNVAVKKDTDRNRGLSNYLEQMSGNRTSKQGKRKLPEEWNNQGEDGQDPEGEDKPEDNPENNPENPDNQDNPEENKENQPENPENKPEDDVKEPEAKKPKREGKLDKLKRIKNKFEMVFVNELKDSKGKMQRALLIGEQMYINVSHPDFTERVHSNRNQSKLNITERLCSYIANISANGYKSAVISRQQEGLGIYADNQSKLFEEILDLEFSMESSLRKYLPAIQKEVQGRKSKSKSNKEENQISR